MSKWQAEQLKEQGNSHFKNGEYEEAIKFYSQAIQQNSDNPLYYTNRANARLKLRLWNEVIDDCIRSIELQRDNMKGFYFLGKCLPFVLYANVSSFYQVKHRLSSTTRMKLSPQHLQPMNYALALLLSPPPLSPSHRSFVGVN
jgi:tetratricopeptide (TPR) repeat protein